MDEKKRRAIIKEICRILNIHIPHIIYVKGFRSFGTYYCMSQKILIRADMDILEEVSTLAHELRHVYQHKIYGHYLFSSFNKPGYDYDEDWFEIDATNFGLSMLKHFNLYIEGYNN